MPKFDPCSLPVLALFVLGVAQAQTPNATTRVDVGAELEQLSAEFDFEVRGLEQTQGAMAHTSDASLVERLHLLLEDFDHVIVQSPDRGVERVIILGEKAAYAPPPLVIEGEGLETEPMSGETIVLATQRRGASHLVTLGLEGGSGEAVIQESMLIDTGADRVVLPVSLISALGLEQEELEQELVQTANGVVEAYIANLEAIRVGSKRLPDVEVAFIDDQRLGGTALLGMSLLGRFSMTIDDARNQLTLVVK